MVSIIPLDEPYLLLFPSFSPGPTRMPECHPNLSIYSFFPSASPSSESAPMAGRHVCTLELPTPRPGEHVTWSRAHSGDRRADETTGHFRTDPSRSIVVLYINIQPIEGRDDNDREEYATYLLIPRATLIAQIRAAESKSRRNDPDGKLEDPARQSTLSVPWADWGPRGCLRLRPRNSLFYDDVDLTAFGSRMPVVMFDGPEKKSASVYVFDVNPLVARSVLAALSATGDEKKDEEEMPDLRLGRLSRAVTATAVDGDREDIEEVLPGIVDTDCVAIPYAVYRFPLPYSQGTEPQVLPEIREVTMSLAGFTVEVSMRIIYAEHARTQLFVHAETLDEVEWLMGARLQFDGSVDYEKRFQTLTV